MLSKPSSVICKCWKIIGQKTSMKWAPWACLEIIKIPCWACSLPESYFVQHAALFSDSDCFTEIQEILQSSCSLKVSWCYNITILHQRRSVNFPGTKEWLFHPQRKKCWNVVLYAEKMTSSAAAENYAVICFFLKGNLTWVFSCPDFWPGWIGQGNPPEYKLTSLIALNQITERWIEGNEKGCTFHSIWMHVSSMSE